MKAKLIRVEQSSDGVRGVLSLDNEAFCVTMEPEEKDNQAFVSCIPVGSYVCERYSSDKYPNTFEITEVPGRYNVLFHAGNTEDDTAGCVLVAQHFGKLKGKRAVLNSGNTFKEFMARMDQVDRFLLTIKYA